MDAFDAAFRRMPAINKRVISGSVLIDALFVSQTRIDGKSWTDPQQTIPATMKWHDVVQLPSDFRSRGRK